MYVILNSKYLSYNDKFETQKRVCDVYAPTESELPSPADIASEFMAAGSWAWLGEEREFRTLNDEGQWV